MKTVILTVSMAGVVALGSAPAAVAAPTGGSPATEAIEWLQEQGYAVQLNGTPNGPLSQCIATGVHGFRDSNVGSHGRRLDPAQHATVYVDISCNTTT